MGSIRKNLYVSSLPDRELHHSRLFVDLAENIHIHHREYRTVFSLNEYFEYAEIIRKSTQDVRNFLEQNPTYEEEKYPTTIMIAGGKERQLKYLENSPKPNQSNYFANEFAIELQDEFVTDEIHIHYRDFRIALDRERFRVVANGFKEALVELDNFESSEKYERETHPDHVIKEFNDTRSPESIAEPVARLMGFVDVAMDKISSVWFENGDWNPYGEAIKAIQKEYTQKGEIIPIVLSTEADGSHRIIDGHHRFYALNQLGVKFIQAVICPFSFKESEAIRHAEASLKKFDIETNFEFEVSSFFKSFIAFRLNRFYSSAFKKKMVRQRWYWRFARTIKRKIFGKRRLFKSFNESHNHHN
jgi:hypothetical protein